MPVFSSTVLSLPARDFTLLYDWLASAALTCMLMYWPSTISVVPVHSSPNG